VLFKGKHSATQGPPFAIPSEPLTKPSEFPEPKSVGGGYMFVSFAPLIGRTVTPPAMFLPCVLPPLFFFCELIGKPHTTHPPST